MHPRDEGLDRVGLAHVELGGERPTAGRLDRLRRRLQVRDVAVAERDVRAEGANVVAIASPMPTAAPVTIVTRSVSSAAAGSSVTAAQASGSPDAHVRDSAKVSP